MVSFNMRFKIEPLSNFSLLPLGLIGHKLVMSRVLQPFLIFDINNIITSCPFPLKVISLNT